jgi:acetylornithine deacetylase
MKLSTAAVSVLLAGSTANAWGIPFRFQLPIGNEKAAAVSAPSTSTLSELDQLLDLHKHLVQIPSISKDEDAVGKWLASYLRNESFTVEVQTISDDPPRSNILAYMGDKRNTKSLITSHIDTVPPYWPYERRGDEIWGRGSVDAKGSVATQIQAVKQLRASKDIKEGDIGLLYVVGEEIDGDGMHEVPGLGIEWETVIFGEPTELKLATGHKGILSFVIKAHGKAAHSGYPELGRSANKMLIPALHKLMSVEWPSSEEFGNTTFNIGLVEGGVAGNVVPEEAYAKCSLRIAAGEPEDCKKLVREAVEATTPDLAIDFGTGYGPVPIDHDVEGFDTIVVNYGTDIPNLKGNFKRYLYGPGSILLAHSDHEHIAIKDMEEAVEGYKKLILHSLA